MIPVQLEIEGLYSYKEKQTIDFTQLTGAGLFGIFGSVGSGKSSILEAVLLALYGTTERLASKGEKNSMVNLQSPGIAIHFEFQAGKNNAKTYKASYIAKRNTKNFDDVKPATHTFYEKTTEGWLPLDEKGEALVGMKMDHFRQTVIIPQGKFREFIEQKPKDRAEMMKELFGLERFDLAGKTKQLLSVEKEKKIKLETQLEGLAAFTKDALQASEGQLHQLTDQKQKETQQLSQKEQQLNSILAVKEKAEQLIQLKKQMEESDRLLPTFQQKRTQLKQYQTALAYVKPLLDQFQELEIDLEKYRVSVTDCERFKTRFEQEIEEKNARYHKLYQDYSHKGEKEARIRDLLQIKELNKLSAEKASLQQNLEQLAQQNSTQQEHKDKWVLQIDQTEKAMEQLDVPDMAQVSKLETALLELRQLEERSALLTGQLKGLAEEIKSTQSAKEQVLQGVGLQEADFTSAIQKTTKLLQQAQKDREHLLQQQGLYVYAHQLKDGEACPLCGALEHPEPLEHHFDEKMLNKTDDSIQQFGQRLEALRAAQSTYEKLLLTLENTQKSHLEKQQEADQVQQRIQYLLKENDAKNGATTIEQQLETAKTALKKEKTLQQQLKSLLADQKAFLAKSEQDLVKYQEADQQVKTLQTKIETKLGEVNFPDLLEKYRTASGHKIDEDIAKVKHYLDDLEVNLPRAQDALNEARQQQTTNLANLKTYQDRLAEVKVKLEKTEESLSLALAQHDFANAATVKDLLAKQLDPAKLEEEIKVFDRQRDIILAKMKELQADEAVAGYDQALFTTIQEEYQTAKSTLEATQKRVALLQKEIEDIHSKLEEKTRLKKEFQQVENRESNLKELYGLFQGSGFVKYVSNIYLKELVQTANIRFMQLSKNSLTLEVDESNTFWVKDHLNGGKKRLLKTLSGGQTFQASLCLALALAEKVKSLNRADQSFFFLDEGFGALDKNALRTVFETLKSLRHEKRIVGIISHVEELQQEIGVYAQVELDPEKGSQVTYSF
ncbi:SMC family ATPase [Echinicola strongylocentroti]|uniref:SMC family ATPase n=1 Tax=Echinicola strongylocentroti TaxID=1795355 RepID=A0A2Z4ILG1_9BACT|nr:SMC family ATPase [Echinicola strongylocentroti]AWW31223.1 SMC family ATPase [Echinicola strongylocentroti]